MVVPARESRISETEERNARARVLYKTRSAGSFLFLNKMVCAALGMCTLFKKDGEEDAEGCSYFTCYLFLLIAGLYSTLIAWLCYYKAYNVVVPISCVLLAGYAYSVVWMASCTLLGLVCASSFQATTHLKATAISALGAFHACTAVALAELRYIPATWPIGISSVAATWIVGRQIIRHSHSVFGDLCVLTSVIVVQHSIIQVFTETVYWWFSETHSGLFTIL